MPFVIEQSANYKYPVRLKIRKEDGSVVEHEFHAVFKRMGSAELDAMIAEEGYGDALVVSRTMVGWEGVQAVDGTSLPFEPAAVAALCDVSGARRAIVQAFFESLDTESTEAAAEKN